MNDLPAISEVLPYLVSDHLPVPGAAHHSPINECSPLTADIPADSQACSVQTEEYILQGPVLVMQE